MRFQSLLLYSFFTLCLWMTPAYGGTDTIAVLPFFNQSSDASLDWIGESVAETLRESLSGEGALALSREERVEVYRRLSVRSSAVLTRATVLKIGERMDAAQLIFGHFELSPAPAGEPKTRRLLKITASIIDAKRLRAGPQFVESGPLEDLNMMESRLAWQALSYFLPKSTPAQSSFLESHPPVRIAALESYTRGLLSDSPAKQERFFQDAARLDGKYSEPAFELGHAAFENQDYPAAASWFEKVAPTASHYHEAQFLLGICHYYQDDFEAAAKTLEKVAAAVPLDEVYNDLGAALSRRNRPEAADQFRKALEGDDADPDYWFNLGYVQWKTGRIGDAIKSFHAVLERSADDDEARTLLKRCERGDLPHPGETLTAERIKQDFEETVYLQLQAELKK